MTPDQLTAMLDALEARLPLLIVEYPDQGDFWMAFAGEAEVIEDQSGEHAAMVRERIETMLAAHGRHIAGIALEE